MVTVVVVIPGATKEMHVKENTGAMSFRLSDEDMEKLNKESSIFEMDRINFYIILDYH